MSDLAAALMVAIKVHAGQVDKQGEPYLLHVHRVVESVNRSAQVVAALHDVIEDGGEDGLRAVLGLDLDAVEARALSWLTRRKGVEYADYIEEIATLDGVAGGIAREVKLADLRDNLGRIPSEPKGTLGTDWVNWDRDWKTLKRRYEKAIATLEASS